MNNLSCNTHDYDTFLNEKFDNYKLLDDCFLISPMEFKECVLEIKNRLEFDEDINKYISYEIKKNCFKVLDLVLDDRKKNIDEKNKISFEDLLPRVWRFIQYYEPQCIGVFFEQLSEILNGSCPQGRTTRIFQFYSIHMNDKDELFLINLKK